MRSGYLSRSTYKRRAFRKKRTPRRRRFVRRRNGRRTHTPGVFKAIYRTEGELIPAAVDGGVIRECAYLSFPDIKKVCGFKEIAGLYDQCKLGKGYWKFFIKRAGHALTDEKDEVIKIRRG